MIGVKRGQRRNRDDFASRGPIPKERGLKIVSILRLSGNGFRFGKNIQGGRRGGPGHHVRATDRKRPGRVAVKAPAAMDTPLLRLLVHGAAMGAMHNPVGSLDLATFGLGRLVTFLALTVLAALCYGCA